MATVTFGAEGINNNSANVIVPFSSVNREYIVVNETNAALDIHFRGSTGVTFDPSGEQNWRFRLDGGAFRVFTVDNATTSGATSSFGVNTTDVRVRTTHGNPVTEGHNAAGTHHRGVLLFTQND